MESKRHSKNIFDYDVGVMCDNCGSTNCVCDEIEREAGFVKSYKGKTAGKYVCKVCRRIPIKCKC